MGSANSMKGPTGKLGSLMEPLTSRWGEVLTRLKEYLRQAGWVHETILPVGFGFSWRFFAPVQVEAAWPARNMVPLHGAIAYSDSGGSACEHGPDPQWERRPYSKRGMNSQWNWMLECAAMASAAGVLHLGGSYSLISLLCLPDLPVMMRRI